MNIKERIEINELATIIEEQLFISIIKSKKEGTFYTNNNSTTIIIKKKKLTFKDAVNKVILENRKKRSRTKNNKFATIVWQKIIEKRQDFVDENAIDYSKVRDMWKKGSVTSTSSSRSIVSNNDSSRSLMSTIDSVKARSMWNKGTVISNSGRSIVSNNDSNSRSFICNNNSIHKNTITTQRHELLRKKGSVKDLAFKFSK